VARVNSHAGDHLPGDVRPPGTLAVMPSPTTIAVFSVAALALFLVPGPSVLYVVARSVEHGRRAGFVSVLGIHAGSVVHVAAAAAGLSALIVSSALAFSAVKYAGAAYLIWLGVWRWRAGGTLFRPADGQPEAAVGKIFRQGFVVNLLNPKTALFFLAFLPQFVDVDRGPVPAQILVLGLVFVALGIMSDSTYALVASTLGRWLRRSRRAARAEPILSGSVYVGLGVPAAMSGGHASTRSG
jgi:threonine/homoserine/homoserine lactone efflux protein